jgi:hypothetical protein
VISIDLDAPSAGRRASVIELTDTTAQLVISRLLQGSGRETYNQRSILSRTGNATQLRNLQLEDLIDLTRTCPAQTGQPAGAVVEAAQLREFGLQIEFLVLQGPQP